MTLTQLKFMKLNVTKAKAANAGHQKNAKNPYYAQRCGKIDEKHQLKDVQQTNCAEQISYTMINHIELYVG